MEEDTVVMGSDGLFDNVFDREIVSVVSSCDNVFDAGMLFLVKVSCYLKLGSSLLLLVCFGR